MARNDTRRVRGADIAEAVALLTRMPVRTAEFRGAKAAWAWPLAGLAVAVPALLVGWAFSAFGLQVAALAILATQAVLTGAMHEDGLADCADGFWGANDATARLEIMKDSQIGTYGVLALILSVGIRWQALVLLFNVGSVAGPVLATAMLSRAPMAAAMAWLPSARSGGLAASVGTPGREAVILAGTIALLGSLVATGFAALAAALAAAGGALLVGGVARAKIRGQTGDVLGAAQQAAEICALLAFAAVLA